MRMKNTTNTQFSFKLVVFCFFFSSPFSIASEAENDPVKEATSSNKKVNSASPPSKTLTLSYFINNQSLLNDIKYDHVINLSKSEKINDGELLILKHNTKNRKKRGNVLFLHTHGESANHHRLVRPLSTQLSQLGWNVFIPNIAKEDFLKPQFGTERIIYETEDKKPNIKEQSDTSIKTKPLTKKNDNESEGSAYYFDSVKKYQRYIIDICEKISADPEWLKLPRILILNQTSSYWGLSCLTNQIMPTVFLDPELPLGVENNLEDIFSQQSSSFYVFYSRLTTNTKMASFSKAFSSNQWQSKNQRYSQDILTRKNLNLEDIDLAKRITGWAEKLRKAQ